MANFILLFLCLSIPMASMLPSAPPIRETKNKQDSDILYLLFLALRLSIANNRKPAILIVIK